MPTAECKITCSQQEKVYATKNHNISQRLSANGVKATTLRQTIWTIDQNITDEGIPLALRIYNLCRCINKAT